MCRSVPGDARLGRAAPCSGAREGARGGSSGCWATPWALGRWSRGGWCLPRADADPQGPQEAAGARREHHLLGERMKRGSSPRFGRG